MDRDIQRSGCLRNCPVRDRQDRGKVRTVGHPDSGSARCGGARRRSRDHARRADGQAVRQTAGGKRIWLRAAGNAGRNINRQDLPAYLRVRNVKAVASGKAQIHGNGQIGAEAPYLSPVGLSIDDGIRLIIVEMSRFKRTAVFGSVIPHFRRGTAHRIRSQLAEAAALCAEIHADLGNSGTGLHRTMQGSTGFGHFLGSTGRHRHTDRPFACGPANLAMQYAPGAAVCRYAASRCAEVTEPAWADNGIPVIGADMRTFRTGAVIDRNAVIVYRINHHNMVGVGITALVLKQVSRLCVPKKIAHSAVAVIGNRHTCPVIIGFQSCCRRLGWDPDAK